MYRNLTERERHILSDTRKSGRECRLPNEVAEGIMLDPGNLNKEVFYRMFRETDIYLNDDVRAQIKISIAAMREKYELGKDDFGWLADPKHPRYSLYASALNELSVVGRKMHDEGLSFSSELIDTDINALIERAHSRPDFGYDTFGFISEWNVSKALFYQAPAEEYPYFSRVQPPEGSFVLRQYKILDFPFVADYKTLTKFREG